MAANNLTAAPGALAPYSQEGEEAILGAVLTDPFAFKLTRGVVSSSDFYILRHAYIWQAFTAVVDSGIELDFVSVVDALRAANRLADVGGPGYLLHLVNATPSSQHASTYAELVRRTAVRRRLLTAADEMKALAMDEELSVERVSSDAERAFVKWRDGSLRVTQEPIQDVTDRWFANFKERMDDPTKTIGILSGWKEFDLLIGGFVKGEVSIFGGRPRVGKSAVLLNIALTLAKLRLRVGFCTLEMPREDLILRLAAIEAGISIHAIRQAKITPAEYQRLDRAKNVIRSLPIWIEDTANLTPMHLDAVASRWQYTVGLDLLIVDYLQLMSGGHFKENDRNAEVSFISRSTKTMARSLSIPVLMGAQLNRALESREDKHPQLSDLRESGAIENDADVVHLLYRDKVYNKRTQTPNALELFTAKHRNGPEGTTTLFFDGATNRITNAIVKTTDLRDYGVQQKPLSQISGVPGKKSTVNGNPMSNGWKRTDPDETEDDEDD